MAFKIKDYILPAGVLAALGVAYWWYTNQTPSPSPSPTPTPSPSPTPTPTPIPFPNQDIIAITPVLTGTVPKVIMNVRNWTRDTTPWIWGINHPFGVNSAGTDTANGTVTDGTDNFNYEISFPTSDDEDSNHFFVTVMTRTNPGGAFYTENGFIHITGMRPNWNITYQQGQQPG